MHSKREPKNKQKKKNWLLVVFSFWNYVKDVKGRQGQISESLYFHYSSRLDFGAFIYETKKTKGKIEFLII